MIWPARTARHGRPKVVARGKGREIHLFLWVVSLLFRRLFRLEPIERFLTI
ncbi:MAG TPA: hypothetical protein VII16_11885 [Actinomycetes bacterium]